MNFVFDWKSPNYIEVMRQRMARMEALRREPLKLAAMKIHYRTKEGVADFIDDWGMTFDPRNAKKGLPNTIPFKLFPEQRNWVNWLLERRANAEDGITEKSRDMGLSWLCVAVASTLCLFVPETVIGFGSRKEMLVDRTGDPDSLFWKARMFIELLPKEFRGDWDQNRHSSHLTIMFPATGSIMRGEAGDNIGRGGRSDMYFTDEDAFIPRGQKVDAALSQNTDCRQRVSTVNGMSNPFAVQRHSGNVPVFTFHWRLDPRKDEAWYEKQKLRLDPIILAQEVDLSYTASVTGVVIPNEWVQSSIDAHIKLGFTPTGFKRGALDVADEGKDKNAYASRHGPLLRFLDEWSGVGADLYATTERAFLNARLFGDEGFDFDADGLGAGIRGDARVINEKHKENGLHELDVHPFRGSGEILDPTDPIPAVDSADDDRLDRTNEDFFANMKAQAWWGLRVRFQRTHRAVKMLERGEPIDYNPDELISIDSNLPMLSQLIGELSQPTWKPNESGKVVINKAPDGTKSPNLADAVNILYAPRSIHKSIFDL